LATSNGLPANDFLYLRSEIVRNVIFTKFVCCADIGLLYISKLRPYITTWPLATKRPGFQSQKYGMPIYTSIMKFYAVGFWIRDNQRCKTITVSRK